MPPTTLRVFTLGRLQLERDGQRLDDFVSQKAPALLVYLLRHPREHHRTVLADLFWSDTSSDQALKNLRTVLANLQKSVGEYLDVTRDTLALVHDGLWADCTEFEQAYQHIQAQATQAHSPRRLLQAVDEALTLYAGDFLLGLKVGNAPELDTWLTIEREQLRQCAVQLLTYALNISLQQNLLSASLRYAERLLLLDPFSEQAVRGLLHSYALNGQRNAALQRYEAFAKLLWRELRVEPEPATCDLVQAIRTNRLAPTTYHQRVQHLPHPAGRYIGNESLIDQLNRTLDTPQHRLVTLLGIGGMGKTRLAQHIAHLRLPDYQDGIVFVSLASVTDAEGILQAILQALGQPNVDAKRGLLDSLISELHRQHLLLILDNFEHVIEHRGLLTQILQRVPYVQILVTSRTQLDLIGEHVVMMHTTPSTEKPLGWDLLVYQVQQVRPDLDINAHHAGLARICQLVEGLPLALVIAGAWVQFLSPSIIAQHITESLQFLTLERHDLPERHRGITALLHSTWIVLSPREQRFLQALTVFNGDFDAQLAHVVAGTTPQDLARLVAQSLLQTHTLGRYQQHELLRRFVREQAPPTPDMWQAYAQYWRDWVSKLQASNLPQHELLAHIDAEYMHLWHFEGLSEAEQHQQVLALCNLLPDYWIARGYRLQEGISRLEKALEFTQDPTEQALALVRLGQLLAQADRYKDALEILPRAIELQHQLGNHYLEGVAINEYQRALMSSGDFHRARDYLFLLKELCEQDPQSYPLKVLRGIAYTNLGTVHNQLGMMEEAQRFARQGLDFNRQTNNLALCCLSHNVLGIVALEHEDFDEAMAQFTQALHLAQSIGHRRFETIFAGNLAEAVQKQGDIPRAYALYIQTLENAYRIENYRTILNVFEQLANLALHLDRFEQAATLWGASKHLRQQLRLAVEPRQQPELDAIEANLRQSLGQVTFEACQQVGQTSTIHQLIRLIQHP